MQPKKFDPEHVKTWLETFTGIQRIVYENAKAKGFWDEDHGYHTDATKMALATAEISEVVEALREGDPMSTKIADFKQTEEEVADAIMHLMSWAEHRGLHIAAAILAKIEYNAGRPAMHGKKF